MRISKILSASLAGALILSTSSFANAGDMTFSLVPADPPTTVGIDCTVTSGLGVKNRGLIITLFKTFFDASNSPHDDLSNPFFIARAEELEVDLDNVGDLWKLFDKCPTPAG